MREGSEELDGGLGPETILMACEGEGALGSSLWEGNGVPGRLAGRSMRPPSGITRIRDRSVGWFANNVIDNRSGKTNKSHSTMRSSFFGSSKRLRKDALRAIELCEGSKPMKH